MNIALIGFVFGQTGGIESVSRDTATFLAADGHSVTCIGLKDRTGVAVQGIGTARHIGLAPRSRWTRAVWHRSPMGLQATRLSRFLSGTDLVIVCHAHLLPLVLACRTVKEQRLPTICWIHGREVWGDCGLMIRDALPRATHLVAVSKYTADSVVNLIGLDHKISVVHNPVDTIRFIPGNADAVRRYSILTAGRQDSDTLHKGYDTLIRCLHTLSETHPSLPLTLGVTGDGPRRQCLAELAKQLGVHDRVTFYGNVDVAQLAELYRTHDVFALPSSVMVQGGSVYGEGFGVVNIEAASCGRPVITSTHGGCPETIVDGETGLLVDPTSDAAVAHAIERMFSLSPTQRDEMGARGRENAVKKFSHEHFCTQVGQLIRSLV